MSLEDVVKDGKGNGYRVTEQQAEILRTVHKSACALANEYILRDAVSKDSPARVLQLERVAKAHQDLQDQLIKLMFGGTK